MKQETISSTLRRYRFDLSKPEEAMAYAKMCRRLPRSRKMKTYMRPGGYIPPASGPIVLETENVFDNQWNSAPREGKEQGQRVFDWFEACFPNRSIKAGYYLIINNKMRQIRKNTHTCGFCGKQDPAKGNVFCDKCLDSPYLEEKDLPLLRMCSVSEGFKAKRPELTAEEKEHLLPQYIERQTRSKDLKKREQREDIGRKYDNTIKAAKTEMDGLLWLMDHEVNIGNVIYYSHTDRFCFGWKSLVSDAVASQLLDIVSEFPFNYTIKVEDGRLFES